MTDTTGDWICDYCEHDVGDVDTDKHYLWTKDTGWICGNCRATEWHSDE